LLLRKETLYVRLYFFRRAHKCFNREGKNSKSIAARDSFDRIDRVSIVLLFPRARSRRVNCVVDARLIARSARINVGQIRSPCDTIDKITDRSFGCV